MGRASRSGRDGNVGEAAMTAVSGESVVQTVRRRAPRYSPNLPVIGSLALVLIVVLVGLIASRFRFTSLTSALILYGGAALVAVARCHSPPRLIR